MNGIRSWNSQHGHPLDKMLALVIVAAVAAFLWFMAYAARRVAGFNTRQLAVFVITLAIAGPVFSIILRLLLRDSTEK